MSTFLNLVLRIFQKKANNGSIHNLKKFTINIIINLVVFCITINRKRCLYILNVKIKNYLKSSLRIFTIIIVALIIIIIAICSKYKIAYRVSLNGDNLGYIDNKKAFKEKIEQNIYVDNKTVAFVIDENMPKYEAMFIKNDNETNEDEILKEVLETDLVAYRSYKIVLDGQEKETVETLELATEVVDEIKSDYEDKINLDLGIVEDITYNTAESTVLTDIQLAKATLEEEVDLKIEKLGSTVNDIYLEKPIEGIITSRYGVYSSIRTGSHKGLDIAAPTGTKINPCASGIVEKAEYSGALGNLVVINHGNGVTTCYAHCSKMLVNVGDEVNTDTVIALVGSTGNSTGPHLHLEIKIDGKTINPQKYLYKNQ